jgi:cytoskeletal protein CcmA (bactofilin family)
MAKNDAPGTTSTDAGISIVGIGMTMEGDTETDGSLRIEGTIRGNVRAGKSVVIGKDGLLEGSIYTQEAVIAGRVLGSVYAESHLELHATSQISGEIQARRLSVEDGAALQGQMAVGQGPVKHAPTLGSAPSSVAGES